jgi:hypothetical protein
MEAIDGVSCIKGEIHSIMTSMRLSTRWSNAKNVRTPNPYQDTESPFVDSYRKLNEYLEGIFDLTEVDCVKYISPFYDVIVSDSASGPLTSAALSSVCKFAMFGFLSTKYPRAQEGILLVAKCISRCIFEETDWESDEVILMKLLELSTLTLRCDAAKLLSVGAAWDIYSTCLSIHNQFRASKILRSEAETALRHLTQSAFSKAHQIYRIEGESSTSKDMESLTLGNQSWETISSKYLFDGPVGITLLLCNIMSVLSNLMNLQSETPGRAKFALSLINIALEAGGPMLSSMHPLVDVLKGDVSRHLLRATQSEDLEIFSLALRVVFNLFMSIKNQLKVQLEVFLTSIHLRLLQHPQSTFLGQARQELALESLLEFCREPSLMQDLYTNYDCDVQCTNLFDSIITVLCERCQPTKSKKMSDRALNELTISQDVESTGKPTILNRLAVSGVSSILHAVALKCRKSKNTLTFLNSLKQFENTKILDDPTKSTELNIPTEDDIHQQFSGLNSTDEASQVSPSEPDLEPWCEGKQNEDKQSLKTSSEDKHSSEAPSPISTKGSSENKGMNYHRNSSFTSTTGDDSDGLDSTVNLSNPSNSVEVVSASYFYKYLFILFFFFTNLFAIRFCGKESCENSVYYTQLRCSTKNP